jgi:hypothetical protein
VRDPALTQLRLDLDKVEYRRGQPVVLRVRTLRSDFSPAAAVAVALELRASGAAADAQPLRSLKLTTDAEGEAQVDLGGLEAGAYRLSGRATLDGRAVQEVATLVVRPEGRELEDVVARDKVLREIAEASKGEFREGTIGNPSVRPPRKVRVGSLRTIEIWSHPLVLLLAVGLLAAEWMLRRRRGHA